MLCRASVELMSLRLDGMLGPEETLKLEEHLSSCSNCRAQYLLMREADNLLRTSARRPLAPPSDFSARVMQRVAATPVNRPGLWERERAQIEGGRRTVRLNPTAPINGTLVPVPVAAGLTWPVADQQPGAGGFLDKLGQFVGRPKAFIGGLSVAGAFAVLMLVSLVSLWAGGIANVPAPLAAMQSSVENNTILISLTSLVRLVEGVITHIDPLLVGLFAATTLVLGALWVRAVTWFLRQNRGEITA